MKPYDLSQPLNADCSFWPFYPPFEVKYFKRKSEHGVNAQYIQTSKSHGHPLGRPAPLRHQRQDDRPAAAGLAYGDGVIVDLSDMLDELDVFDPEDIEERVEVRNGDILIINTGWHRYSFLAEEGDEEKYIHRHPGRITASASG